MPLGNILKTVVQRTAGNAVKNDAAKAISTEVTATAGANILQRVSKFVDGAKDSLGVFERDWTCWCGHKFRAAGEWYPTEACYCEAPGCPNPQFFLEGEGRLMLEQKKREREQGIDSKEKPQGSETKRSPSAASSMSSRFR